MSPNVSSFVGDLVEMAKAFEELPQVQAELSKVNTMNASQAEAIQRLEMRIMELKAESEAKSSTIHSLEVARDDAELRFLEADDRANHGVVALRSVATALGEKLTVLDPPKAEEPKPTVAEAVQDLQAQPVEAHSFPDPVYPVPDYSAPPVFSGVPGNVDSFASAPERGQGAPHWSEPVDSFASGQSAPLPTAALPIEEYTAQSQSADEQVDVSSPPKPFAGKLYHDYPTWVSREDWIAGGGDDYSYDWRPEKVSTSF